MTTDPDDDTRPPWEDQGAPGDLYPMDADVTLYWPAVRDCWEPTR